jgi:hypothetical protein
LVLWKSLEHGALFFCVRTNYTEAEHVMIF